MFAFTTVSTAIQARALTLREIIGRAHRDQEGATAMIFAIIVFAMVMFCGLAVDVSRTVHAGGAAAAALDTAALAAAKALRDGKSSAADVEKLARRYFEEGTKGSGGNYANYSNFKVFQNKEDGYVKITVDLAVPTHFARVGGIDEIKFPKETEARYDQKDIEVGLQLDVTGSMRGAKLASLKVAANDLIDILLPDKGSPSSAKVRIGLAPFAAGVNAGSFAASVAATAAPGSCVYERVTTAAETTDAAPYGMDRFKTLTDLPTANACPGGASVTPLTDDKDKLKTTISAMTADGWTAGHLGSAWAWYILSPKWAGIWPSSAKPADYGDKKTFKYAILMTDGQYNTYNGAPGNEAKSEARARSLCSGMKGQKVKVFTIGFQMDAVPAAKAMLKDCATSVTNFYDAKDEAELRLAFASIAREIASLRLTK